MLIIKVDSIILDLDEIKWILQVSLYIHRMKP